VQKTVITGLHEAQNTTSHATAAAAAGWTMASRVASLLAVCGSMTPLRSASYRGRPGRHCRGYCR
jgi:hypothetical protein